MRGEKVTCKKELVFFIEECPSCAVLFGVPDEHHTRVARSGGNLVLYCPNGHSITWAKGEADELREQLAAERRQRQRAEQKVAEKEDEARAAWNTATQQKQIAERERHRANGYKGHATRITKRAKAGVCPCCNRTFQQLARHMATQHPQFTPMALEVIEGGKVA